MQEIKKLRIVIASILKPVDDTRMFEKMGQTLEAAGHDVTIMGYPSSVAPVHQNINFIASNSFPRLSFARIKAKWEILNKILILKPDVFIFNTHELILPGVLYRLITGKKIVYDIRENYYRNIRYTDTFPPVFKALLALLVRLKEIFFTPVIHWFLLAELGYLQELTYLPHRVTVLQNKCSYASIQRLQRNNDRGYSHLIFTGTLAEHTGVFNAIELSIQLHTLDKSITLTIVGYSPRTEVLEKLQRTIEPFDFITLIGGNALVPHHDILQYIMRADFGIVYYPPNPSTVHTIPTKLYEYLACKLPILLQQHSAWTALADPYHAALSIETDAPTLLNQMKTREFYNGTPHRELYWEHESHYLLDCIKKM